MTDGESFSWVMVEDCTDAREARDRTLKKAGDVEEDI